MISSRINVLRCHLPFRHHACLVRFSNSNAPSFLLGNTVTRQSTGKANYFNITTKELKPLSDASKVIVIDVREPEERITDGKIDNSHNIPLGEISSAFKLPDEVFQREYKFTKPQKTDGNVVLTCRSGGRSVKAIEELYPHGYENLINHVGGTLDWNAAKTESGEEQ